VRAVWHVFALRSVARDRAPEYDAGHRREADTYAAQTQLLGIPHDNASRERAAMVMQHHLSERRRDPCQRRRRTTRLAPSPVAPPPRPPLADRGGGDSGLYAANRRNDSGQSCTRTVRAPHHNVQGFPALRP